MSGKSPPAPIFACGVLLGFGRKFSTVVIDHDQMKPRSLEQARKVGDPGEARFALCRSHGLVRLAGAHSHLALA